MEERGYEECCWHVALLPANKHSWHMLSDVVQECASVCCLEAQDPRFSLLVNRAPLQALRPQALQ